MKIMNLFFMVCFLLASNLIYGSTLYPNDTLANNIIIPTIINPTKVGTDKVYNIISLDKSAVKSFKIKIFNRWGQQVFEADTIEKLWDGKNKGKDVSEGVYFYDLSAEIYTNSATKQFIKVNKKGNINLIR